MRIYKHQIFINNGIFVCVKCQAIWTICNLQVFTGIYQRAAHFIMKGKYFWNASNGTLNTLTTHCSISDNDYKMRELLK